MNRSPLLIIVAAVVLLGGGWLAYDYLKEKPPPFLIKWLTATDKPPPLPAGDQAPLTVPEGFVATIFSRETPGARVMIRDPKGTMLVSLTAEGRVVALPDLNTDGKADETITVLEGLRQPHGLLIRCPDTGNPSADQDACVLYIAETGALKSYAYDADTYTARYQETLATFPTGPGHFTRTLLMHPDGVRLLASVGSSCNVCIEADERRASVLAVNLDTKEVTTFAKGLRNTVFMAVHPVTGEVWGTDNGRDVIGDDIPPDEVNIIREGRNYGWPLCYGKRVYDTDFGESSADACTATEPSHIDLQAHSAALGLAFIPTQGWPQELEGDLLMAFHGSWNRSEPTGYKVVRVDLDAQGNPQGAPVDFVTGFLAPGASEDKAIGRPVGLLVEPGVVYVSDDRAGAIYRIAIE
ncbi:MAG TPA: PQQ-dependent sugar dehydrogenase [Candidatus Paceibacterota bacterium]|nr:PQQ-dependent sugar dehydrogenase [Candidatus Paceibacterota bacterium]